MSKTMNFKIVKETDIEVDIQRIADELSNRLEEVLEDYIGYTDTTDIMEDETRVALILNGVGEIWHEEMKQLAKKTFVEKQIERGI